MEDSLLAALQSYRPRPDRNPREDFITEAFAWTLRNFPSLGTAFLEEINQRAGIQDSTVSSFSSGWCTQEVVANGTVDMMLRTPDRTYIFEHKVGSTAHAKQIDKYRRSLTGEVTTVLITASPWNYTGDENPDILDPNIHMTWADVSTILEDHADQIDNPSRIQDFRTLLDHEGIGPREPVAEPDLRAMMRYKSTLNGLTRLIKGIKIRSEWTEVYKILPDPDKEEGQPEKRWSRSLPKCGRIALRIYNDNSYPNINLGLIVDPSDIGIPLSKPDLGPDLSVFLHIPKGSLSTDQFNAVVAHDEYEALRSRLKGQGDADWKVVAPKGENAKSKHHPIVLQYPLAHALRGTTSVEEQEQAMLDKLKSGVELFLRGGEIEALRPVVSRYR